MKNAGAGKSPYNFDEIVSRLGTGSIKYDRGKLLGHPEDVIPMWVADMDFRAAPEITKVLEETVRHGIFGYTDTGLDYAEAVVGWYERRFGCRLDPSWLVKAPGVVFALNTAIKAYSSEGDAVLIQTPVYHPFHSSVAINGRRLVDNTLVYRRGRYTVDFKDFERKLVREKVKVFILCSPHNPVSRVWTEEELQKMGSLCLKHGCVVVADEIHSDFVWEGSRHMVFTAVDEAFQENAVLLTAPSKTFNLAGLHIASTFIPNPALRKKYALETERTGLSQLSVTGINACRAAYERGEAWFEELKRYLEKNIAYTSDFFRANLEKIELVKPEGSYLLWADFSRLKIAHEEMMKRLVFEAGVWFSDGLSFGEAGRGFLRINVASPLKTVSAALERLAAFVKKL
ncbi:MAG: pyridoxal phosphate-dependent aminotransferase [Deltaproteobacteria bacterium]|jgi:cystathionine beta-lyase|nr:pyridoxal phosphate-dependent aminotransferase [Deltaproteobacteria bacterium]